MAKILIDARWIKEAGIGRYIEQTFDEILKLDASNQYVLLVLERDIEKLNDYPDNVTIKKTKVKWFGFLEQIVLPYYIFRVKPDLIHFTNFNHPILVFRPFVITIHDLTLYSFKNINYRKNFPGLYEVKDLVMKWLVRRGARRSSKVITVSNYVKKDIVKKLGVKENKVEVTHLAVNDYVLSNMQFELFDFDISKQFFFYIGNSYPHKNIERMVLAFGEFIQSGGKDMQLVIAGKRDSFYSRIASEVKKAKLETRIIFTGYVTDEELSFLLKKSEAFIYPSLSEGFGLPALEAMINKTLVLSSNATCLPEVIGPAAIYFDPKNIRDISTAMHIATSLGELEKNKYINLGVKQISKYSWRKTARKTLNIYSKYVN